MSADRSKPFEWRQPKTGRRYWELYQSDNRLAVLSFEKMFSSLATLGTSTGTWQMQRKGVLNMDVLVYKAGNPDPIGLYHPHWTSREGHLTLGDYHHYGFYVANFWSTRYVMRDDDSGTALLSYSQGLAQDRFWDIFRSQATMTVESNMLSGADLAFLSGFGFYQIVLLREQAASTVAATSAATS